MNAGAMRRWLERRAEGRDERELARQERGYVVAGVYVGNRTPRNRRETVPIEMAQGRRGTHLMPEVGLPPGFVPPSAALAPPIPSRRAPGSPPGDYDG